MNLVSSKLNPTKGPSIGFFLRKMKDIRSFYSLSNLGEEGKIISNYGQLHYCGHTYHVKCYFWPTIAWSNISIHHVVVKLTS